MNTTTPRFSPRARRQTPRLRFEPLAWLKLQWFCHRGETEVGGFGLSSPYDPLHIVDFLTLKQDATCVTVSFHDTAVADLFDRYADLGVPPDRFARVWLHTHPGASVTPSGTDEETFERAFGGCSWSVMAILGRTGRVYARLRYGVGPRGSVRLRHRVDWSRLPQALSEATLFDLARKWEAEYAAHVHAFDVFDALPPAQALDLRHYLEDQYDHPADRWAYDEDPFFTHGAIDGTVHAAP